MSDTVAAKETPRERIRRIRIKLITSIFTTAGYGTLAAAVIQPLANKSEVSRETILGALTGLLFLLVAIYISP